MGTVSHLTCVVKRMFPPTASLACATVLDHLTLWVPDIDRAAASWRWLLCERLGYHEEPPTSERLLRFRHGSFLLVLEQSDDMVPGMLHSRLRPGLNHLAFIVESIDDTVAGAEEHGWSRLPLSGHPITGGADVAYLEDRDGFEVELVCRR